MTAGSLKLTELAVPSALSSPPRRYLFGPTIDFLCLGGASLLLLPMLLLVPQPKEYTASVLFWTLVLTNVINHPHFAHSYQIFYRDFGRKALSGSLGRAMQIRYLIAGAAVPAILITYFAYCLAMGDVRLLGYAANAMALFVGWHYTKQGYGMLMVDAALKRQFFKEEEKKLLLVNSYVVWLAAWVIANDLISQKQLWGLQYYTFAVPSAVSAMAVVAATVSAAMAAGAVISQWRRLSAVPVNGIVAYAVALYLWLLFVTINPLWLLVVPALHSIQYLVVVWRFQTNYERTMVLDPVYKKGTLTRRLCGQNATAHFASFVAVGGMIGFLGFWAIPILLNMHIGLGSSAFGPAVFLFLFWVFINIHHYFLDSVMWRKENPDTQRFLFG